MRDTGPVTVPSRLSFTFYCYGGRHGYLGLHGADGYVENKERWSLNKCGALRQIGVTSHTSGC